MGVGELGKTRHVEALVGNVDADGTIFFFFFKAHDRSLEKGPWSSRSIRGLRSDRRVPTMLLFSMAAAVEEWGDTLQVVTEIPHTIVSVFF